jgi:hypothetical protein
MTVGACMEEQWSTTPIPVRSPQRPVCLYLISAFFCALLADCAPPSGKSRPPSALNLPWDWAGVIGTGQSLAVGEQGRPVKSTNQLYGNLKLSTAKLPWPLDPNDTHLTLVPLTEPIGRIAPGYPSSWPENISGETPHTAMADQLSAMVRAATGRDYERRAVAEAMV